MYIYVCNYRLYLYIEISLLITNFLNLTVNLTKYFYENKPELAKDLQISFILNFSDVYSKAQIFPNNPVV
jgi:hypothetical protein